MMVAFKSISTKGFFMGVIANSWLKIGQKLWQWVNYDRTVRNEIQLEHIRNHIINNAINQEEPLSLI